MMIFVKEVEIKEVTRLERNLPDILKSISHFAKKKVNIFTENQRLSLLLNDEKKNLTATLLINVLASIG
jgi:regulator of replication initiation timing